ncbi:MAG: hypothetical protein HYZ75_03975 [Elusimicrobia bacterium]|nr:hypothetical protein [Elusimicrobiota bacterium]
MTEIETFFREIDRLWVPPKPGKILLRVIGSGALFLQTDYNRTTKDGDVLETLELTGDLKRSMLRVPESEIELPDWIQDH